MEAPMTDINAAAEAHASLCEHPGAFDCFLAGAAWARAHDPDIQKLVEALKFYAHMTNFTHCSQEGEPEVADDEFPNWMSGEGEYDIENGEVARQALAAWAAKGGR